jgi:hypothetical protein
VSFGTLTFWKEVKAPASNFAGSIETGGEADLLIEGEGVSCCLIGLDSPDLSPLL